MRKIDQICIIDDDPIVIFGTKRILQNAQCCSNFLVYRNGKEGLEGLREIMMAGETPPDIILLDLNMPVMDGWQFLDEFTQIQSSEKILIYIVTSSIDPKDINKAKSYSQVNNYIVKPITVKIIKDLIIKDFQLSI